MLVNRTNANYLQVFYNLSNCISVETLDLSENHMPHSPLKYTLMKQTKSPRNL